MLLAKGIRLFCSRLGGFGLLILGILTLSENHGGWCNMMAPGEEMNSQPSPGVGQRLPDSKEKSALHEKAEDLLLEKINDKKADLAEGQRISNVREAVETDLDIQTKSDELKFIIEMEKDSGATEKKSHAINSALNQIKDFQSKIQDGRGGGSHSADEKDGSNKKDGRGGGNLNSFSNHEGSHSADE